MAVTFADMAYPGALFSASLIALTFVMLQVPVFKALEWQKRIFCALCTVSLVNCSIVTWPALGALYELYTTPGFELACGASTINLLQLSAPSGAVWACGLVCGYFLQDSIIMALFPKETAKELGGATAYKIMWVHHIVSLLVWPYSLVYSKSVVFVVYFMATEVTNIGQNLFLLANRAQLFGAGADTPIGLAWAVTFFVARIVPVPFIMYAWAFSHFGNGACGYFSTAEYAVSLLTVPIPIGLNLYWFYLIMRKATRLVFGKGSKKAK